MSVNQREGERKGKKKEEKIKEKKKKKRIEVTTKDILFIVSLYYPFTVEKLVLDLFHTC